MEDAEPQVILIVHSLAPAVLLTVSAIILKARLLDAHVKLFFNLRSVFDNIHLMIDLRQIRYSKD